MVGNTLQIPSVAVYMVTYNHEKYIRQAVKGIVEQKTNFPYKLFIGEDFSTDGTREICLELKEKYPDKIELLLTGKNIGALRNASKVYEACIHYGKYTAICEGDDYWTDETKLQKQVDFLERNSDFVICCHRAKILDEKSKTVYIPKVLATDVFTQADVANHNFLQTLTVMFRNSAWKGLPESYFTSISGDYFVNMMISESGKIKYMSDLMAVYRIHENGSFQSQGEFISVNKELLILHYFLQSDLQDLVKMNLRRNIVRRHIRLYKLLKNKGENSEARKILSDVMTDEYFQAWADELNNWMNPKKIKEYKVGALILKPYFLFGRFLSKMAYLIHKLKYE
jgi:glycosyltransferase involved in cell wall biosynthesis